MDRFRNLKPLLDDLGSSAFNITPDNDTDYLSNNSLQVPRFLYVGTTGNIKLQTIGYWNKEANTYTGNNIVTFSSIPAGTQLKIRARKIYSDTTANNIIGIY